jgi:lipid-A-disaccharide synthase
VGHPLLDSDHYSHDVTLERRDNSNPVIGLLPGSREGEIARHLPVMLDAARILTARVRGLKIIVSVAPIVERKYVEAILLKHKALNAVELIDGSVDSVFNRCTLVVAASGTVTLETAISGTPMVIIYKLSPISYWLVKALVRVKHIGLVNLIAGKKLVPELVQKDASPGKIADTVFEMLNDPSGLARLRTELLKTRDALGGPGASQRVADIALNML